MQTHPIRDAFFALLRSGLWGEAVDPTLFHNFTEADWRQIYRLAATQALLALVYDGVSTLPPELHPPRTLLLQWAAQTVRVEQANRQLDQMVSRLCKLYTDAGLHPVLLKGQGIATYYRNPRHRQCGDIDVYIGREGQMQANRLLQQAGAMATAEASSKHASYELDGVHVENHRLIATLNNPLASRRFRRLVQEWYPDGAGHEFLMPTPPVQFNAVYIFVHAFQHFLGSGIGLRQVCDWACLLRTCHDDIDCSLLVRQLRSLGMLRAARAFAYIAVSRLGLPPACLPFRVDDMEELGEALLEEVLATGNFGQYDARISPRPAGYWAGKWHTFVRALRRCRQLQGYAPLEAWCYPLMLAGRSARVQGRRLLHYLGFIRE